MGTAAIAQDHALTYCIAFVYSGFYLYMEYGKLRYFGFSSVMLVL
jgi:hypothetical protein